LALIRPFDSTNSGPLKLYLAVNLFLKINDIGNMSISGISQQQSDAPRYVFQQNEFIYGIIISFWDYSSNIIASALVPLCSMLWIAAV
jgi:hypothetical protein